MASRKISTASLKTSNRGFTLMEVILVIALLGIIFGFTTFASLDAYRSSAFRNERDVLVAALQKARLRAMNNICLGSFCSSSVPHGVHVAPGEYIIFQGTSYNSSDPFNERLAAGSEVTISGWTDAIFSPLSGAAATNPSGTWSVDVVDANGKTSTITISQIGRIAWTY